MPHPAPDASDPPEVLLEKARAFYIEAQEKAAVIERIKAYVAPWRTDKRMKVMGEILLREIERAETEEAARVREA